jgi:glutathione peroxidase
MATVQSPQPQSQTKRTGTVYDFTLPDATGNPVSLADYKGKVLLIVNTASHCKLTPQFTALNELQTTYGPQGFQILAVPSDSFNQEFGKDADIQQFCDANYRPQFKVFGKVPVKGAKAHPLFRFLSTKSQNGRVWMPPMWNFHKYLIDRNGRVRDFYMPFTSPTAAHLKKHIQSLL